MGLSRGVRGCLIVAVVTMCVGGCTSSSADGPAIRSQPSASLESLAPGDGASPSTAGATRLSGDLTGLEIHPGALSPDGTRLAAVVEAVAGRQTAVTPGYGTAPTVTRYGPTQLWVWDTHTGVRLLMSPVPPATSMRFTPYGSRVITDDPHLRGALLRAFDVATGREVARYARPGEGNPDGTDGGGPRGNTPATRAMFAIGPDGARLVTYAGNDFSGPPEEPFDGVRRVVRRWDASTATVAGTLEPIVGARVEFPPALSFTPDGGEIVAGVTSPRPGATTTSQTSVVIGRWSAVTGALRNRIDIDTRGGTAESTVDVVVGRRDGGVVAVGRTRREITRPDDGAQVSTTVWSYDSSTRRQTTLAQSVDGGQPTRYSSAVSPDGRRIAILATVTEETPDRLRLIETQTVSTFDAATGRRLHAVGLPPTPDTGSSTGQSVEYSPDGTTFVIAGRGLTVHDSTDPRVRRTLQSATDAQRCDLGTTAQYSGDGTTILGSGPCGARVFDTATARVVAATR